MPVSKRLRYEILRRDGHICRYCGGSPPDVKLTVDHVVPVALGGGDEPSNLVTACSGCNAGKSSVPADAPIVEAVSDDAIRWAKAMQAAAEIQEADRNRAVNITQAFLDDWRTYYIPEAQPDPEKMNLPHDWPQSVERFVNAGLTIEDLKHAIAATHATQHVAWSRLFRYCCGICWNKLQERQEIAAQILTAGDA